MKSKFTGLFRSLFGQGSDSTPPPKLAPAPVRPPTMAQRPVAPPVAVPKAASAPAPKSVSSTTPPPAPPNGELLEIPLAIILNTLPMDLKAKMISAPSEGKVVFLPVETIVAQLAFGAVKITFGELRQLTPNTFANTNSVYDSRPVSVPLNEILARINPALLARRATAQKFEVSEEISGPFGGRGNGVAFTANPIKAGASPAAPARSVTPPPSTPPVRETKPVSPVSFAPPASPTPTPVSPTRQVTPTPSPAPLPLKSEPIAFSPRQNTPLVAPVPFAEPSKPGSNGNGNGNGNHTNGNGNGNGSATLPPFKFTAAPVPPSAASGLPAGAQPTLTLALIDLAETWASEIKTEIVQSGLTNAYLTLPLALIEPGLKRGRVTITWKELRALIKPNLPASPSDDLSLELPLKVLAPAFLAAQKKLSAQARTKVAVSSEIPNLFFGFPQPEPPAPPTFKSAPLPPVQSPAAENSIPAARNPHNPNLLTRSSDTNLLLADEIDAGADETTFSTKRPSATEFLNRQTQPKDVVAGALALPGVAGAVVALADGLRVAGEVPPELNADTVAAFLPQIFERVSQSTRELRMGALNNISFTVGNVPWKMFRVNSVYFAAFGRAGEALPKAQLATLAAGLDRKQK